MKDIGLKKNSKQVKDLMVSYIYGKTDIDLNAPRGRRSKDTKKEPDPIDKKLKLNLKKQMSKVPEVNNKVDQRTARKMSSDSDSSCLISQSDPSENEKMPIIKSLFKDLKVLVVKKSSELIKLTP